MAGPQSLTPKPVSPSRRPRRFTLAEANSSLPLVKRIVADIVRTYQDVTQLQQQLESAKNGQQAPTQDRLHVCLEQLQDYVDELSEVGCELKDYRMGLIDFIGKHQGREVCLCWKLGEEKVGHWHEMQAGYAGRQPVATLKEN
jgi:hypothetical protein